MRCSMPLLKATSSGLEAAAPAGSHLTALTSSWWPTKHFCGVGSPSLHTKMRLSVEQVAKDVWFRQSTSSVGAAHFTQTANQIRSKDIYQG